MEAAWYEKLSCLHESMHFDCDVLYIWPAGLSQDLPIVKLSSSMRQYPLGVIISRRHSSCSQPGATSGSSPRQTLAQLTALSWSQTPWKGSAASASLLGRCCWALDADQDRTTCCSGQGQYLLMAKPSGSLTVGTPTIWMPKCRSRTMRLITCTQTRYHHLLLCTGCLAIDEAQVSSEPDMRL